MLEDLVSKTRVRVREGAKKVVYRTPGLDRLVAPRYPYKVDPGELTAMIGFINATRESGGAVAEVGVARGATSAFMLEHLRTTEDPRTLLLFDTFDGFTEESIEYEVSRRGKSLADYGSFRYGGQATFDRNLQSSGFTQFRSIAGDASAFDWSSLGPVGAVLLDVDLYQPTISILEQVYDLLVPGGGIVVDDCRPDNKWDGSLQAYEEFIAAHGLPREIVGHKGGVVRKAA